MSEPLNLDALLSRQGAVLDGLHHRLAGQDPEEDPGQEPDQHDDDNDPEG